MHSLSLIFFGPFSSAIADPIDPFTIPDEAQSFRQERQVVTVAARYAQTIEEAPSIVRVITADDILQQGFRTLSDVLRTIPGVYVASSKESRQLGWFRGSISSDNNKILLLINGIPWYDGVYTHAWLDEYIPLFHVEQIEIIKGPGSAIYGTNAFAGVINVVTSERSAAQGSRFHLSAGGYARREVGAHFNELVTENVRIGGYARYMESDGEGLETTPKGDPNLIASNPKRAINGGVSLQWNGFDLRYDFVDFRHTYYVNPQYDAWQVLLESSDEFAFLYHNDFFSLQYSQDFGAINLKPYLFAQSYDNDSAYAFFQEPDSSIETGTQNPRSMGLPSVRRDVQDSPLFLRTIVDAPKYTLHYGAGIEGSVKPSFDHHTVFGVGVDSTEVIQIEDLVYQNGSSSPLEPSNFSAPPGSSITDIFSFVQHTWTATWWLELNAGIRVDMYNDSSPFFSPRLGFLMVPYSNTSIKLLYGRAFRAPNAREWLVRLTPDEDGDTPYTNGNPDLVPESIDTIETEATAALSGTIKFRTSMFYSLIQNEINKVAAVQVDPDLGRTYYGNVGTTTIFGGEAEFEWKPSNFLGVLNYSFVHSTNENTGFQTYEFPPHMGHMRLGWNLGRSVWLTFRTDAYGPRPRAQWTSGTSELPDGDPFALCHLTASALKLKNNLRVSASILNIFDQNHKYLVYQNDATEVKNGSPKYPYDMSGEGRSIYVSATSDF